MIAGNYKAYNYTIVNGATQELDLSSLVGTEFTLKVTPSAAGARILFTPRTSAIKATLTNSYALPGGETEFSLGRGLCRLSILNNTGVGITISLAILY